MSDRDTRQLIIAFTAILLVWSIACVLTFASGRLLARKAISLDDAPAGAPPNPSIVGQRLLNHQPAQGLRIEAGAPAP